MKWIVLLSMVLLAGCDERYRYPCQDPEHWEDQQCKKPYCSANGTCPEDLTPYEKKFLNGVATPASMTPAPQNNNKGECK